MMLNSKISIIVYLFILIVKTNGSTHWKVTETGRIELNDDSPFSLLRPYDLDAFIKQSTRLERLEVLKELISNKDILNKKDISNKNTLTVSDYQEKFYKSDLDCIKAGQQLAKFSFFETYFNRLRNEESYIPEEVLSKVKLSDVKVHKKPFCDFDNLPFSMKTFDHLESIQSIFNVTMTPEIDLAVNMLIEPNEFYGHLLHKSLMFNSTSWVYYTMASDYFRYKGDFPNSVKCLQRAIYYASNDHIAIPLLNLANMLHKVHFLNDSLSIALSTLTYEDVNAPFAYFLGNIYVTLGQLDSAHEWFQKAYDLDSSLKYAYLKKHATACHLKLEEYLEEQHENLQKKLNELKEYQIYTEEWFKLNSKLESEKSSPTRKEFTKKFYQDFISNSQSVLCNWKKKTYQIQLNCRKFMVHYTIFPFNNQTVSITDYINNLIDYKNNENHNSNRFNFDSIQQNQAQTNSNKNQQQHTCSNLHECNNMKQKENTKNNNNDNYINNISEINIKTVNNYVNRKNQASTTTTTTTTTTKKTYSNAKIASLFSSKILKQKLINNVIKPPPLNNINNNNNLKFEKYNDFYSNSKL